MAGPHWLTAAIAYMREHARAWRTPVHWHPPVTQNSAMHDTSAIDRYGNQTVRARQQFRALSALDDAGAPCVVLEITPVEPAPGYERTRVVLGRARYELKDGTPVTRVNETLFQVSGSGARLTLTKETA